MCWWCFWEEGESCLETTAAKWLTTTLFLCQIHNKCGRLLCRRTYEKMHLPVCSKAQVLAQVQRWSVKCLGLERDSVRQEWDWEQLHVPRISWRFMLVTCKQTVTMAAMSTLSISKKAYVGLVYVNYITGYEGLRSAKTTPLYQEIDKILEDDAHSCTWILRWACDGCIQC